MFQPTGPGVWIYHVATQTLSLRIASDRELVIFRLDFEEVAPKIGVPKDWVK